MLRSIARHAKFRTLPSLLFSGLVLALPVLPVFPVIPAHGQGWIDVERPTNRSLPSDVVRVGSEVRVTVEGRVARVEIEERFRNTGSRVAEGSYFYPLPGEAVFTNFSLWMGDQEVRGETMNAEQARAIYEDIVRRRKDPALLTFAGHGLVRAQVFPIEPGDTRKVVLRYSQLLTRAGDALRLGYAFGNRGTTSEIRYSLTVPSASSYGTPYSPTHQLDTRRVKERLEIVLASDAAGQLEIFLPLRQGLVGTSLVTHAPGGEEGYFMLLLAPPNADSGAGVPRDLTLVVDVSGSMSGTKLEQAKAALNQALGTIGSKDRFRVIAFSSQVRRFRDGFLPATRENLTDAREFVDGLGADGGTNIAGALDAALDTPGNGERLSIVVFMTDGLPSIGEQAPDKIAEQAAGRIGRTRVFTIGIGHDVNTYLLDRLASRGRGVSEYVAPGSNVETAIGLLLSKIRYPALVNLRIGDTPVPLSRTVPAELPDLFYGEELVVLGRYTGHGSGTIVVTGERNGKRERIPVSTSFPANERGNEFIPRLWAARQIGSLTRQIRLEGASSSLVDQVRQLGLRYGILTEYTSYLVQEPTDLARPGTPVPLREEQMGGARNSALQTGTGAFEQARISAKLSDSKSLDAVESAASTAPTSLPRDRAAETRRAGGRLFIRRGQVWTDAGLPDRITVTDVAAYSRAYFELVRQLPEVAPYLSVGEEILIAGRQASVRIGSSGVETWQPGQLAALVRNFRGT
jgi:Ca-activated chloride channel family protein